MSNIYRDYYGLVPGECLPFDDLNTRENLRPVGKAYGMIGKCQIEIKMGYNLRENIPIVLITNWIINLNSEIPNRCILNLMIPSIQPILMFCEGRSD